MANVSWPGLHADEWVFFTSYHLNRCYKKQGHGCHSCEEGLHLLATIRAKGLNGSSVLEDERNGG